MHSSYKNQMNNQVWRRLELQAWPSPAAGAHQADNHDAIELQKLDRQHCVMKQETTHIQALVHRRLR